MKWKVKTIVYMGLLVSISIILTRGFGIMIGNSIRISFGNVPIMLSGILFGPVAGAVTGIAADLVGFMIRGQGTFFPGFTLSAALTGLIPGLLYLGYRGKKPSLPRIILIVAIVNIFISFMLNTFWLSIMFNKGFLALLPGRIIARLIIAPLEVVFIVAILRLMGEDTKT